MTEIINPTLDAADTGCFQAHILLRRPYVDSKSIESRW